MKYNKMSIHEWIHLREQEMIKFWNNTNIVLDEEELTPIIDENNGGINMPTLPSYTDNETLEMRFNNLARRVMELEKQIYILHGEMCKNKEDEINE
jgi:hypothetical protein